jgi:hypothetical protein
MYSAISHEFLHYINSKRWTIVRLYFKGNAINFENSVWAIRDGAGSSGFHYSTSGNFEYESMTTKIVFRVGNGFPPWEIYLKNPCEVYPMVWKAIGVVEDAVEDHHARDMAYVTMLNKLFASLSIRGRHTFVLRACFV